VKAHEFLGQKHLSADVVVDAKKNRIDRDEALKMAHKADEIYSMKGKKIVRLDLKNAKADDEEIASLMMGPTGNLRAPTWRSGKTIVVGFNEETYLQLLKK
jgi:arsenate reductase-like glutaredoxin family protein